MGKRSTQDKSKTMAMGKLVFILVICLMPKLVQTISKLDDYP
jgi:hypothetical protein